MNSIILSALADFGKKIFAAFRESVLFRALNSIYSLISGSWNNSAIVNKFKNSGEKDAEKTSILYRIIYFPFLLFEKIGEKTADAFSSAYDNSFILRCIFDFLDNALALNTRFLGVLILSAALVRLYIPLVVIGIALTLCDFNITDFFAESRVVMFFLSFIGFKNISFDIYNKENVKKPASFVMAVLVGALTGALSAKSLIWAAIPFAALFGAALILKYPLSGIFFTAFFAPLVPTMLLAALTVYTSICFCLEKLRKKDLKWKLDSVGTGLGFFLIFMFVSSIFSFSRNKSILVWGLYLIFIGYYFIIINAVKTEKALLSIIKIFVISGLFVSLYGIAQYVFGWDTANAWIDEEMFESATMRAYSTMENPNVLGEYLLFIVPLSAFLMIKSKFNTLEKWFWMGTLAASTLCMVLTQSRGCWIGLFAAVIVFVTFYNGKLWGILPFLLLALPFILPQTMIDRFLSVGNLEDSSTSYRVFIWLGTLAMLKDFWIGGIGMGEGAFRSVYPFYSYNSIIAPHSHNLYLQFIVEGGIAALVIFLITIIVYLKKTSMQFSKRGKNSICGVLALTCACAVFGFLVQSMFDYTFYNYRMMAMFFMILALSVSIENIEPKAEETLKGI